MASKHCQESGQCLPLQVDQKRCNAPTSQDDHQTQETGADKNHTVDLVTVDYKPKEIQQMYAAQAGKPLKPTASQKQFNAAQELISRINSELRDKQELTLRVLYGFQYTSQRGINIKAISPQFRNIDSEIDKVFSKPEIQIQEVDNLTSMLEKLEENLNIVHQSNETDFSLKKARSDEYEILHGAIILWIKNELEKKKKLCELLHHFTQYASSQCDTSILQHLADEIDQVFSKPKALVQLGIDGLLSMLRKLQQKQKIEDSSDSATIPCKEGTPQSQYAATIKQSQSEEGRKVHVTTKEEEDEEEKAVEGKASSLTQEDDVSSSKGRVTMVTSVQTEGETQATPQEAIGTNQPPTEEKEDVGPEDTTEAATAEQTKKEEEVVSKKVTKSYAEVVKSGHASCSQAKQQLKGPGSLLKETKKAARPSSTQHLSPAPAVPTPSSAPSEKSKTDGEGWQVVQERHSTKARLSSKSADLVPLGQMEDVNRFSVLIDSNEDLSAIDDDAVSDTEAPRRKELGRSSCATSMTSSQKKSKTRKSAGRKKKIIRGEDRQTKSRKKPTSNLSMICIEGTTSGQGSGAGQQKDEIEKEESAGHSSPNADTNLSLSPIPTPPSAPQKRSNQKVAKDRSKLPKTSMLSRKADPVAMNESQQKRKNVSARKDDNAVSDPESGRKESGSARRTTSKTKSAQSIKKTRKMQNKVIGSGAHVKHTKTSLARAARFHKNDQKKMESGWSKRGKPGLGNISRQEEHQTRAKGKPNIPGNVGTSPDIPRRRPSTPSTGPGIPTSGQSGERSSKRSTLDGTDLKIKSEESAHQAKRKTQQNSTTKRSALQVKQTKTSMTRAASFIERPPLDSNDHQPKGRYSSKDVSSTDQKKKKSAKQSKRDNPVSGNSGRQEEQLQTRAKRKPNIAGDVGPSLGIPRSLQGRKTRSDKRAMMDCKAGKTRTEQRRIMNLDKNTQVKQTRTSLARAAGFQSKGVASTCTDQMKKSACSRGKPVPQNTIPAQEEQQERPRIQRRPSTPSTCTGPDIPRSGQSRERSSKRVRKKTQQNSTSKKSALQVKQTKTSMTRAAKFPNTPTNHQPKGRYSSKDVPSTDQKKKKSAKQSKRDNPVTGNSGRQEEQLQARSKKKPNAPSNVSTGPGIPRSGQGRESRSSVKIRPREGEGGTTIRRDRRGQDLCQLDKTADGDQAVRPKIRERRSEGEAKKTEVTSPSLQLPSDLNNERASHRRRNIRYPDYGTINIIHNPLSSRSPNVPSSLRQDGLYNNIRGRSDHREEFWQSGLSAVESARNWALPGERNENRERRMDRVFGQLLSGLPDQNISPTRGTTEPNGDINQSPDHMAHKQVLLQGAPGDPTRCMYSSEEEDHLSGRSSEQESKIDCAICMETVVKTRVESKCKHIFHQLCMEEWLKDHNTCPLCRKKNPLGLSQDDSPNTDVAEEPESQQRTAVCNVCNHSDQGSASQLHPGGAYITVLDHAGQFLCRKWTPLTPVQGFARSIQPILERRSFTLRCRHGYNIPWNTTLGYQDTTVQVFPADEHGSWSWRIPIDDEGFAGPPE